MKLIKNKKAEEGTSLSLKQLIGMVVAIIALVFLFSFTAKLYAIFASNPDQGSYVAFENLVKTIDNIKDGDTRLVGQFYIDPGLKVIGFNKEEKDVDHCCGTFDCLGVGIFKTNPYKESKPTDCLNNACLALCDEKKGGCRTQLKKHVIFTNVNRFIAKEDLNENEGSDSDFVLYGECNVVNYKLQNIFVTRKGNDIFFSSEGKVSATSKSDDIIIKSQKISGSDIEKTILYAKDNSINGRTCECKENCIEYAKLIDQYSEIYSINPLLLLSLMMQESGCKKEAFSGSSYGLMQINLDVHCGNYLLPKDKTQCKEKLTKAQTNIMIGSKILYEYYNTYKDGKQFIGACTPEYKSKHYSGWFAALRAYNGWGCNKDYPQQDRYVDEVMVRYEKLNNYISSKD